MIVSLVAVVILGSGANSQFAPLSQLFNSPASGSSGFISVSDAKSFVDQLRCTEFVPLGASSSWTTCSLEKLVTSPLTDHRACSWSSYSYNAAPADHDQAQCYQGADLGILKQAVLS